MKYLVLSIEGNKDKKENAFRESAWLIASFPAPEFPTGLE